MSMNHFPPLNKKDLPGAPKWSKAIGVGIVIMGMAMGTGELILWPHLTVKFGLGILWLALIGITLQYFINQEVIRHTMATGESFFTTSGRVIYWSPIFWLIAAILLYIWPGWAGMLGTILSELFGFGSYMVWAWLSLFLILIITFKGKRAYEVLELGLKIIVPVFIILLIVISFFNLSFENIKESMLGLLNFGYIPKKIDINVLLGAIVFAGAGGMLNLCVSLWYRDKQAGMAAYEGRITNPISGKTEAIGIIGSTFLETNENISRWKGWMRYVYIDQGIIFWFLGIIALVLLSLNANVILGPLGIIPEGAKVATEQAKIFSSQFGNIGRIIYLIMAYLMLFSVMWTVIDALARIITDIIHTNSREGRLARYFMWLREISIHHLYYGSIILIIFIQAILIPWNQPIVFLIISSVLGGVTMAIYTPFLLYLNNKKLHKEIRPGIITNLFMFSASIFYIYFVIRIIIEKLN